jgi:hypothetical protein
VNEAQKKAQNSVKNVHFKRLKVYNPNQNLLFEEKQIRMEKNSEQHFLTIDQTKAKIPGSHKRSLVFSFMFLNSFLTTKLDFIHQKLECTIYKRMPRSKASPETINCFNGLEMNFGYYSMHLKVKITRIGKEGCKLQIIV